MIYIGILVLIVAAVVAYKIGLSKGRKQAGVVCDECLNDVYMQGYDAGAHDQAGYMSLQQALEVAKESADEPKAGSTVAGSESSKKRGRPLGKKNAVKKPTKKGK